MSDATMPQPPNPPTAHPGGPPHTVSDVANAEAGDAAQLSATRNVATEFVAVVILMLAGPGAIVLGAGRIDTLGVALSFGAALALAIGVIGAVANPALTLALMVVREISPKEAVEDWIGQFSGGVVGAALIWGINDTTRAVVGANGWDHGGYSELGSVAAGELVFTVIFVVVFLSAIKQGLSTGAIAAFTGMAYAIGHLVLLEVSGAGLNPARSLGSALFSSGDPHPLGQVVVFIVVPLVAAVAAVFVWLAIDDAEVDDTIFDETFIDDVQDRITAD